MEPDTANFRQLARMGQCAVKWVGRVTSVPCLRGPTVKGSNLGSFVRRHICRASGSFRHWRYSKEQKRQYACPHQGYILEGEATNKEHLKTWYDFTWISEEKESQPKGREGRKCITTQMRWCWGRGSASCMETWCQIGSKSCDDRGRGQSQVQRPWRAQEPGTLKE